MPQNKWCFVSGCKNTSVSAPNKIFVTVPQDYSRKAKWFKAARRDVSKTKTAFFCCEDHFNFKEDMENYVRYTHMGGNITLKPGVVPHIFTCQPDRKRTAATSERSATIKRVRKVFVEEVLLQVVDSPEAKDIEETEDTNVEEDINLSGTSIINEPCDTNIVNEPGQCSVELLHHRSVKDVGVQVRPSFRSKYVSCQMNISMLHASTSTEKLSQAQNVATSPFKHLPCATIILSESFTSTETKDTESMFTPASDSDFQQLKLVEDTKLEQQKALDITRSLIVKKPKSYCGIPGAWYPHLLELLSFKTNLSKKNIQLTLMKIKLNDSFSKLGDSFGMSTSNASKLFKKTLPVMEHFVKTLIYWPEKHKIELLLPIAFRARYSNVQSIIDCFEIQIQKPSDPIKQSLTLSEYKKCNSLKYLVSSTPDGFINFISKGYGGRISDSLLVEDSGYLDVIPAGCGVMADRGFKDIAKLLQEKKCALIRPPSVSSTKKPTKAEVLETKRVASLRIHIERVIRRIREFEYLKPHSVIDHNLISHTDNVLVVACALINLQTSIIK